jgi:hypothetical protein
VPTSFWRSADAVERLSRLDRAGFAAEFLRRNETYRRDFRRTARAVEAGHLSAEDGRSALARRWGCLTAPNPDGPPGAEPVLWLAEISPATLVLGAAPPGFEQTRPVELARFGAVVADIAARGRRQIAVRDHRGELQIALLSADALRRPAAIVPLDGALEMRIAALRRLTGRRRGGVGPPRAMRLKPLQRARLIQLLRAHDIHAAGGGPREIAAEVVGSAQARLPAVEWKDCAARRAANRLLRDAIGLVDGGYLALLRGQ